MKDISLLLKEAKRHFELTSYTKAKIEEKGLREELLEDKDFLTLLDAFIFRFIKLQSSVGEKLFPLAFEILTGIDRTEVTFFDILNYLEKYGIIPSAEYWKKIRKLRNEFVHIYPWETELKLEAVKLALKEVKTIGEILNKIESIANENKGSPNGR
jgi:hypothetical protein